MKKSNFQKFVFLPALFFCVWLVVGAIMCTEQKTAYAEVEKVELLARFCTYYGDSSPARKSNVELASRKINGVKLYPEDEFSFNSQVGARTVENGFKTAYIIQDGEFVEGVGGGVCQVSSTLYNCALLSNLTITSVSPHSLGVSYVSPSFDAMVSSASDFRFVNTLSAPITIKMKADGKNLVAEIFGVGKRTIKRRSETLETIPFDTEYRESEDVKEGEEVVDSSGKDGIKSRGYLDFYENGNLVRSVLIRQDFYAPQKRIVLINKKSDIDYQQ